MISNINISEVNESADETNQEFEGYVSDSCDEEKLEEPTCSNNCEKKVSETNEVIAETQSECSPCQPSTSEVSRCPDVQNITEPLPTVSDSSKKGQSTSFDPSFVETYFKVRRVNKCSIKSEILCRLSVQLSWKFSDC